MSKIIYLDNNSYIDKASLTQLIYLNIVQNNIQLLPLIKKYHHQTVQNIADYMLNILGDHFADPYTLNSCFYEAIKDLNINLQDLSTIKSSEKTTIKQAISF